jgi:hypothetical protein
MDVTRLFRFLPGIPSIEGFLAAVRRTSSLFSFGFFFCIHGWTCFVGSDEESFPASLACVKRHVPRFPLLGVWIIVEVDHTERGGFFADNLFVEAEAGHKKPNKASHPTPANRVVGRLLASILVLVLHNLRASIRGVSTYAFSRRNFISDLVAVCPVFTTV